MKYFLAIDLGASSGRHIVGYKKNNEIILDEIHRFKTEMEESKDGLIWDLDRIFKEIIIGIKKAFSKYHSIESLSIDSWGVDYVLLNGEQEIKPFYAYRNKRNKIYSQKLHEIISFDELYQINGLQFQHFNTIYQLYADLKEGRLVNATDYLMIPSYFIYKLTGQKIHEYTNESTTGLLNLKTKNYDFALINKIGLPLNLFKEIKEPKTYVGELLIDIQKEVNGNTKVILVQTHDTASAFNAIDNEEDSIIISSGTWSLLGIKSKEYINNLKAQKANYTNEGGFNYYRFLKNIMGMYLINKLKEETNLEFDSINQNVINSTYHKIFDVNHESLNEPKSMKEAIKKLLNEENISDFDLFSSIYHSLAFNYQKAIRELENIINKEFKKIYIIGGGANNEILNNLVKEYTKKEVIALPIEATSLGNIKMQIERGE